MYLLISHYILHQSILFPCVKQDYKHGFFNFTVDILLFDGSKLTKQQYLFQKFGSKGFRSTIHKATMMALVC